MLAFDVLTIFPSMFRSYFEAGLLKRALEKGIFSLRVHDLRDFTTDRHRVTDDYPFGGGQGMVMKVEPIVRGIRALKREDSQVVLLTPQGLLFNQEMALDLAKRSHLILICGRYEGVDERVAEHFVDLELSIGNYILTGGELPAMVIMDAVTRVLPGTVGEVSSIQEESLSRGLLKYPQYTRPAQFEGLKVPEILLSGDHEKIARWRRRESIRRTYLKRPELLAGAKLTPEELAILEEIRNGRA